MTKTSNIVYKNYYQINNTFINKLIILIIFSSANFLILLERRLNLIASYKKKISGVYLGQVEVEFKLPPKYYHLKSMLSLQD